MRETNHTIQVFETSISFHRLLESIRFKQKCFGRRH